MQNQQAGQMRDAPSSVPYFNVSDAPPELRFDAYAESVDPIFDTRRTEVAGDFSVGLDGFNAGPVLIGRSRMWGASFHYDRDVRKVAQTGVEAVLVQIVTKGCDVRLHDGEAQVTRPGDICIADMTRPFATRTEGCDNISMVVHHAALGLDEPRLDGLHGLILGRDTLGAQLMADHARMLVERLPSARPDDALAVARATGLMLGGLIAPMVEEGPQRASVAVAALFRIKRFIRANLAQPDLGPDSVAKAMGMSRASLYRAFAPLGSVGDFIRRQRLERVLSDLGDPACRGRSIAEIAYGWGFADWSTFSRAFRSAFGITPSEARVGGAVLPGPRSVAGGEVLLPQWIRTMDAVRLPG
ncbi:helix-turn-helix domain-containing protein [Sphingomonas sp. R1]|uniref:helix-turn-helix domain-containing protein n=1 Tax=Sphingomonas sp. R1 TaxID=399176 RepID=UPI002224CEC1|nr:helix-turn-helix domain-containing protein [Sphingomonas sp. R1]UYY77382.1 helix-turn-helix domain-containing protein [Sphingomonas sp. R1]